MITHNTLSEDLSEKLYKYNKSVTDRIPTFQDVTDEDIKRYWNQGYLVIENAFSNEEVSNSIDALMHIMHGGIKGPKVQLVRPSTEIKTLEERELACRKIMNYVEYEPRLAHMSFHMEMMKVLERICGERVRNIQNTALLKPPLGGSEKPWHQDMAYRGLSFDKPAVGVWIALDEACLDNGCMHVIPGSHKWGAMPHYVVRDLQICDNQVPVDQDVTVPLKPGGLLIFHGLLYHGTPANLSPKRRRALQNHYIGESAKELSPREHKRIYTNKLSGAEC
jgi:phytanoyl-CoA hydroxylase